MTNAMMLTEAEVEELDDFLSQVDGGMIPNTEALDGFFAALACCPDLVMPSEYLPVIQEGETEAGDLVFESAEEAQRFMALIGRHWNHVNRQLNEGTVYLPLVQENERGGYDANDWAKGFLTGTELRREIWSELFDDEEHAGSMIPILALAYEHDPDPKMRPFSEPVDDKKREDLLAASAAGVMQLHAYFLGQRGDYLPETGGTIQPRHSVGRNAPCPCGSGQKYKRCCGQDPTFH